jgi:hypothetical protein
MDSLELKVPAQDLQGYLADVRHISRRDKETFRKAKQNKASASQRSITSRTKNWSKH